ncbi:carbon starvation protein A [Telmatobacter bradus]|uniref:carbon starvation CstA family protein n=1 Tax=Telmatobacter bradus TaxID=474953 RepID=UPI003B432993
MNTLALLIGALCVYALGYRYYSAWIAAKVLTLDDRQITPAHKLADGRNYVASPKWVLFGHHFAAIAGAGPLIGPTLAAQFGFVPGFLWIVVGAVLGGCVHDFTVLVASARHQGKSLVDIARTEIGPVAGVVTMLAVLSILLVTVSGLGIVVVNSLSNSPWGVFTIAMIIPIAMVMGVWMFKGSAGKIQVKGPSIFGIALLLVAVFLGHVVAQSSYAHLLTFSNHQITLILMIYGAVATALPVWLLLEPRDYLATYVKLGTISLLILGIFFVHPQLQFPAFTNYVQGGGPIIHGKLFPFLFITIACGSISGFHALISSGTTPKMLDKQTDARFIGYGAMAAESLVAVVALVAACSLNPGDYYAINVSPTIFSNLGLHTVDLNKLSMEVGEHLAGRTGGGVSLAIGMAHIFRGLPGMDTLVGYWYHYAIMFEALFILTTVDAGTRVARYVVQELLGKAYKPFGNPNWIPGVAISTVLVVGSWGYMIYTGSISTIWPLFGAGNQLLATVALAVCTAFLVNSGRAKYIWITVIPMIVVGFTTVCAAVLSITQIFWPLAQKPETALQGTLDASLMTLFLVGVVLVVCSSVHRCWSTLAGAPLPEQSYGAEVARESSNEA